MVASSGYSPANAPNPDAPVDSAAARRRRATSMASRPSLASPDSRKTATIDYAFLADWNKQWQDYYDCKGPLPSLPLAPGTNSPASDDGNDCNTPVAAPTQVGPTSTTTNTTR